MFSGHGITTSVTSNHHLIGMPPERATKVGTPVEFTWSYTPVIPGFLVRLRLCARSAHPQS